MRKDITLASLPKRNAITYSFLVLIVMMLGLSTRRFSVYFPNWINLYIGDALWALMIFCIVGLLFRTKDTRWVKGSPILTGIF